MKLDLCVIVEASIFERSNLTNVRFLNAWLCLIGKSFGVILIIFDNQTQLRSIK